MAETRAPLFPNSWSIKLGAAQPIQTPNNCNLPCVPHFVPNDHSQEFGNAHFTDARRIQIGVAKPLNFCSQGSASTFQPVNQLRKICHSRRGSRRLVGNRSSPQNLRVVPGTMFEVRNMPANCARLREPLH